MTAVEHRPEAYVPVLLHALRSGGWALIDAIPQEPENPDNEEADHDSGDHDVEPDNGPLSAFHAGDIEVENLRPNQIEFGGILVSTQQDFVERAVIIGNLPSSQADKEKRAPRLVERLDSDAAPFGPRVIFSIPRIKHATLVNECVEVWKAIEGLGRLGGQQVPVGEVLQDAFFEVVVIVRVSGVVGAGKCLGAVRSEGVLAGVVRVYLEKDNGGHLVESACFLKNGGLEK